MVERELALFTPIPPEQNGIADYSYHLISALQPLTPCAIYANQPDGLLPPGVPIRDPAQAFRYIRPGDPILHQVGNNPGHIFVLEALRKWGGVTTLHDQNLHFLYEAARAPQSLLSRNMIAGSEKLGAVFARHWFEDNVKTLANYALFDMLHEVLSLSTAVIVHSRFAKNRIRLLYGAEMAARVHVVPHLALEPEELDGDDPRAPLQITPGVPLVLTSGFATAAKRFDWLVQALDALTTRGVEFFWVHAGKERPDEYDLTGLLDRYPAVKARTKITGYLTEQQLNAWVSVCDILVNLRFPSVGESSGTLARAMAAGRCCVVSRTAAYADLPTDSVMHIPVSNAVPALAEGLQSLFSNPGLRASLGERAFRLAHDEWAPETVARTYLDIMTTFAKRPPQTMPRHNTSAQRFAFALSASTLREDIAEQTRGIRGSVDIRLSASSAEQLAEISLLQPHLLQEILPCDMQLHHVAVEPDRSHLHVTAEPPTGVVLALQGVFE